MGFKEFPEGDCRSSSKDAPYIRTEQRSEYGNVILPLAFNYTREMKQAHNACYLALRRRSPLERGVQDLNER